MKFRKDRGIATILLGISVFLLSTGLSRAQDPLNQVGTQSPSVPAEEGTAILLKNATQLGVNWLRTGIGNNGPDWAKRIEFEFDLQENNEPVWSILTVQPVFQTVDKSHTCFTQARLARNQKFGDSRTTVNLGLGYRQLFNSNTLLLGANAFFDYESDMDHTRIGGGLEAKWNNFDFFANFYEATSDIRNYSNASGSGTEEALDGFDLELTSQVPYLPWMRIRGKYFEYDSNAASDDVDGWSASTEMDLHPNMRMEIGITDDNFSDKTVFANFTLHLADNSRPVATTKLVDDKPFEMRDMTKHSLDKVRRTNTITVERVVSGSITISRQ
jgi:hypothetical protein